MSARISKPSRAQPHFLQGGGTVAAQMREHPWSKTTLGAPAHWPRSLQAAVGIMLLSRQPMCIWWGDRWLTLYNDAFAELLGAPDSRALGAPADTIWPGDWNRLGPRAASLLSHGHTDDEEFLVTPSGRAETFRRTLLPGDDGTPAGIVWVPAAAPLPESSAGYQAMQEQITERTLADAALRESEGRFRHLADNVPVLIWVNGLEGCDFANRAYLDFLRRPIEDIVGTGWQRFVHPDDATEYLQRYADAMEHRAPFEASTRLRRGDGEYRWVQSSAVPRLRADGALLGYIGCSWDITEMKLFSQALEEADRRKDTFLATLAHELRNPLAPLRHGLQIMQLAENDASAVAQARAMMKRQLQHMVRLIDDLLDVSRITLGKVELRRELIEIGDVVRSAVETSRPHIDDAGQRLQLTLPTAALWVHGDSARLSQVLSNLLNNASKFTSRGGRITFAVEDDEGTVVLRVSDTGVGIPPDKLREVFDIFTQVDQGEAQDGLGVGLSIARQLIEMHGGEIEGRSRGRGQGSEFVVRLPGANPPMAGGAKPDQGRTSRPTHAPLRILIADDNVDSATSLSEVLRMLGHEVRTAHDGQQAVDIALDFRPDVMLLDIGMPRLNGYDSCRRIRKEPWGARVVMVAVTGWGQAEHRARARSAGFDHHLVKPVELSDLQAVFSGSKPSDP